VIAIALAAGYLFWLRDSSLVRVERVDVGGLTTPDGAAVRAKLRAAALDMTTLHVDESALRKAVADEPIVQSLRVQAEFPHALRITVVENRPVAMLVAGGRQVAVAPDGSLLAGAKAEAGLPTVRVGFLPTGGRMASGATRQLVAVAAAAPARLLPRVSSIQVQRGRGVVAQLQHGPAVVFGHADQLAAKWAAATAVLAQRSSKGATYIDVRLPSRPVAGGLQLQQDPQPEAQTPSAGASSRSPGVIPADPGVTPSVAGQAPQAAPVAPAPTTPAPSPAPVQPAPTNTQP
jgi:cell division septal protein FtsQ